MVNPSFVVGTNPNHKGGVYLFILVLVSDLDYGVLTPLIENGHFVIGPYD
jgi:hypothetical protein